MKNIVETKELTKSFGGRYAVDHVSMTIRYGDIYGLIGKNGAGKTTFMRMLCGLAKPDSGKMSLFKSNDLNTARRKMGCTIESPALYPSMTAEENLEVYRILLGIPDKGVNGRLLKTVGLDGVGIKKAKNFSLGMEQRLMIAIALMGDPELLILDEPMNGLDPEGIKEMRNLLLKLNRERDLTIVVSSHILEELFKIATRYGVIHDGKMVAEFSHGEMEEKCRKNLTLRTDAPQKALQLISEKVTKNAEMLHSGEIVIFDRLNDIGNINRLLVENGITVTAMIPGEQSLEDYFMTLIGGKTE